MSKVSGFIRKKSIDCSAVVLAAGESQRYGADKIRAELMGTEVISYSLATFQSCDYVKEVILVVPQDSITQFAALCDEQGFTKVTRIVIGGATRLESALSGVSECRADAGLIAIHDGARPLVTLSLINSVIECAQRNKAAIPAIASRDTVKIASNGLVSTTPERQDTYCAQTPQVFDPIIIKGALTNAIQKDLQVYDDASAVEILGFPVYIVPGSEENIKITTALDLKLAELILAQRKNKSAVKEGA